MRSLAPLQAATPIDALSEVEVLHGICHAYGSAQSMSEALTGAARWARAAVGSSGTMVRISLVGEDGALTVAMVDGGHEDAMASSVELDAVIRSRRPRVVEHVLSHGSKAVAVLPLVSRGQVFGTLELAGDRALLERRWLTVTSVASQLAIALRSLRDRERLPRSTLRTSRPPLQLVSSESNATPDTCSGPDGRVLVVDGQRLFAEGMHSVLKQRGSRGVWIAGTAAEAMAVVLAERLDVVLIDMDLPDGGGLDLGRRILQARPNTVLIALADAGERRCSDQALRAGFRGFVTTDMPLTTLLDAMDAVARGRVVVPPPALPTSMSESRDSPAGAAGHGEQLTARERQVLTLLVEGRGTKELARRLDLSRHTVRTHIHNIMSKLGVHSRLEAATYALLNGIVELEPAASAGLARVS
jgi:DNA-binding NarL/FixJ family response regulator